MGIYILVFNEMIKKAPFLNAVPMTNKKYAIYFTMPLCLLQLYIAKLEFQERTKVMKIDTSPLKLIKNLLSLGFLTTVSFSIRLFKYINRRFPLLKPSR